MTLSAPLLETLQRAVAAHQSGKAAQAERLYKRVLNQDPNQPDALNLLGVLMADKGDTKQAIALFDRAIAAAPHLATVPFNKGNALSNAERLTEARAAYEQALACDPAFHDARLNLGVLLQKSGDTEEALQHFIDLIQRAPNNHANVQKAHYNIGKCHQDRGQLEDAEAALLTALSLNPNDPDAHFAIANIYADMRRHQNAIDHINNAIQLKPAWAEAHSNLGNYLCALDRANEAVKHYETALALDPKNATARVNMSIALLSLGRLAEGWAGYSDRAASDAPFYRHIETDIRRWSGQDLSNKTALIWHEQGLGEEILYAGLLREFVALAQSCTLVCSPKLKAVFERSFADMDALSIQDDLTAALSQQSYDVQASLVDLGRGLRPSLDSFPEPKPYLSWDHTSASALRQRLKAQYGENQLFVGISWSSANPIIGDIKTIPLDHWSPLLAIPDIMFVNVQYGTASNDLDDLPYDIRKRVVSDHGVDLNGSLGDTLLLLAAMDHCITCSNTTAHLAGAAGLPTWVVLPSGSGRIWYWFSEGFECPWYADTRLYRQNLGEASQEERWSIISTLKEDLIARRARYSLAH